MVGKTNKGALNVRRPLGEVAVTIWILGIYYHYYGERHSYLVDLLVKLLKGWL